MLSIFKMGWTVPKAQQVFEELSSTAFSPRELLRVPVFKNMAQFFCSYRYKTDGIEGGLKKALGNGLLFGQELKAKADLVKAGVVAGMPGSKRPYLMANYSRNPTKGRC